MRSPLALALALTVVIVGAACGGGGDENADKAGDEGASTTTSTALAVPANPLPGVPGGAAPLTALSAPDPLGGPALIVKIDNAPKGR
ncbi:MAG: hypothetical protein ACRDV9_10160, partial [Acidimicrobiia bacterium]